MSTPPFFTKFPDIDSARNKIQREAQSLDDVAGWVKDNGWFLVATALRAHQRVWSLNKQRLFYRAHRNFTFDTFTLVAFGSGLRSLSGHFPADLEYSYPEKGVRDEMRHDEGLRLLGLSGSGGSHFGDGTVRGKLSVRLRAENWHFVAEPSILAAIGSSLWDAKTFGVDRWYPDADLDNLHLLHQSVGADRSTLRALAAARLRGEATPTSPYAALPALDL